MTTVRFAWLLALGRLTVVAFFAIFLVFIDARLDPQDRAAATKRWRWRLRIGSVISFASMVMASQVGETEALRLHATELLMLLGTAIVLLVERPVQTQVDVLRGARAIYPFSSPSSATIAEASLTA